MNEVLKYLTAEQDNMLACLKAVVEHETPSKGSKADNDEFAAMFGKKFEELVGGKAEVLYNSAGYGNHLMATYGDGAEQILILCHYDTVWPKTTIVGNPFRVEDGKAYGPGIYDMKGGIVQGLALDRKSKNTKHTTGYLPSKKEPSYQRCTLDGFRPSLH